RGLLRLARVRSAGAARALLRLSARPPPGPLAAAGARGLRPGRGPAPAHAAAVAWLSQAASAPGRAQAALEREPRAGGSGRVGLGQKARTSPSIRVSSKGLRSTPTTLGERLSTGPELSSTTGQCVGSLPSPRGRGLPSGAPPGRRASRRRSPWAFAPPTPPRVAPPPFPHPPW